MTKGAGLPPGIQPAPPTLQKADIKPNHYTPPGPIGNTQGLIVPRTEPNLSGNSEPVVKAEEPEEGWLDKLINAYEKLDIQMLKDFQKGVINKIDGAVEASGYSVPMMVLGSLGTAVAEVFLPVNAIDLIPGGKLGSLAKKGGDAMGITKKADEALPDKPPGKNDGGYDNGDGSICKALAAAVFAKVPEVAKRFLDLFADKLNLFNLTVKPDGLKGSPHPSLPKGSGTWHGHLQQLDQKQRGLRDSIQEYDGARCVQPKIPKPVRDLAWQSIPNNPGTPPGYPFNQLPK